MRMSGVASGVYVGGVASGVAIDVISQTLVLPMVFTLSDNSRQFTTIRDNS